MEIEQEILIEVGKTKHYFSKGVLAKKLELLGFSFVDGYELSIKVYEELLEAKKNIIEKQTLDQITIGIISEQYSKDLAKKYEIVEAWRESNIPLWIIIAGAIGVGKSTLSRQIAGDLGIQHVIGSDIIRDVLRRTLSPEITPELHSPSYLAYSTLRPIYSARYDDVIIGYENHAKFVNIGVEAILSRAARENTSVVIEGEHLLPSFFDEKRMRKNNLVYITMSLEDTSTHLENLGFQYSQEKEELIKNFDRIRKIHDYLAHETKIRKLPLVEMKPGKKALDDVRGIIIQKIASLLKKK